MDIEHNKINADNYKKKDIEELRKLLSPIEYSVTMEDGTESPYTGKYWDSFEEGIYVDNINTCVEMVNQGLGWAIVPEICLKNFKGQIKPLVFKNAEAFTRSTYLLYSNSVSKLPQVREFIKIIQNRK